jgi:hypothetical protein
MGETFMEAQGWNVNQNVVVHDNVSSMKLEEMEKVVKANVLTTSISSYSIFPISSNTRKYQANTVQQRNWLQIT